MPRKKKRKYDSYLEFLETRLNSPNFKANATPQEIEETKAKIKRERELKKLLGK